MRTRLRADNSNGAVISIKDAIGARILAGLSYASQPADSIKDTPVQARGTTRPSSRGGLDLALDIGGRLVKCDVSVSPVLDPRVPVVASRAYPPGELLGVLSIGSDMEADSAVASLSSHGVTRFVNLGLSRRGIPGSGSIVDFISSEGPFRGAVIDPSHMRDPVEAAVVMVLLSASGCPVHATTPTRNRWMFGSDLSALVESAAPDPTDDLAWMARAAKQKTVAWTQHLAQIDWSVGETALTGSVVSNELPTISVLLATLRPELLSRALGMISVQESVKLEVLVAIHGGSGMQVANARSLLNELELRGTVINPDRDIPLGIVLNMLGTRAEGDLITKWDDDDLYGPLHLLDSVAALRHSGADLVGKAAEFTHFEEEDITILRNPYGAEADSEVLAGGTLALTRQAWDRVGGFPPLPKSVDHYLKRAVSAVPMRCFRTHGFGFSLVRHTRGHTWDLDAESYRATATKTWQGLPSIAAL